MNSSLRVNSVDSILKIPKKIWENIVDIDNPFFAYDRIGVAIDHRHRQSCGV